MDGMLEEIFEKLKGEILADEAKADTFSETLLRSKIERAYREVMQARRYPSTWTAEQIAEDIVKYRTNIEDIAEYDYAAVGSEGLSSYSADGTSLKYNDRNKLFYGVLAIKR